MIKIDLFVDKKKYCAVAEACEILGVSLSLFKKIKAWGVVNPMKIGKTYYYERANLNEATLRKYAKCIGYYPYSDIKKQETEQ